MATTKNLCAQIPIDLHERVSEERERLGQTTSEYITNLIQEYYDMIENQKGGIQMTEKGRTMAFSDTSFVRTLPAHQASLGARDAPNRQKAYPARLRAEPDHAGAGRSGH